MIMLVVSPSNLRSRLPPRTSCIPAIITCLTCGFPSAVPATVAITSSGPFSALIAAVAASISVTPAMVTSSDMVTYLVCGE